MAEALAEAQALFDEGAGRWSPPPRLTVGEWAERHRKLPEASAAKGAPWRNAVAPYLVEIMNVCRCARDEQNAGVRAVALAKAAQTGGSSALENIIGFHIEHDSCPILVVHPTDEAVEEWSKDRFDDLVRSTPALAVRVRDRRAPRGSHQSGSTIKHKVFPGGQLFAGSAKSPNTFARRAARLVIADDFDRFPATVGEEGDPGRLLSPRTASFHDGLLIYVSTPTLKGGRIDTLYGRSDKRRFVVACPHCGREDWITWGDANHLRIVYDGEDANSARLECPAPDRGGCGGRMGEAERRRMVMAGRWRPTAAPQEPGLVGFHLPAMVSTLGGVTLAGLVSRWLSARAEGREALRVFINTYLGEAWEDRTAKLEPHTLIGRREAYGEEGVQVPQAAVCLTAGVDVQLDRFELQVIGWGPGEEKWVIDYRAIPGDPRRGETRSALLEALSARYLHSSGHMLAVMAVCVDSGYATDEVYDFVFANQRRWVPGQPPTTQVLYATKGFSGRTGEPIVGKPSERGAASRRRAVRLYPVNVDDAKTAILVTSLPKPIRADEPNPGGVHFPLGVDEEYFAQLCAEHREAKYNASGVATHFAWIQDRERNEALDTAVLALAAFRLLNPNLLSMTAALAATRPPAPGGTRSGGASEQTPPAPPRGGRQTSRSGYLGR
jgi:phage terminase large subunit GpA-like protein